MRGARHDTGMQTGLAVTRTQTGTAITSAGPLWARMRILVVLRAARTTHVPCALVRTKVGNAQRVNRAFAHLVAVLSVALVSIAGPAEEAGCLRSGLRTDPVLLDGAIALLLMCDGVVRMIACGCARGQ